MKIGLFGGTFNPIHYGHLRAAEEVREYFSFDKIIFIPAGIHPLKYSHAIEGNHRLKMTALAIKDNPYFELSDYEVKLQQPSYTVNTINYFKKLYEYHNLWFIIGVDSFLELPRWYKFQELLRMIDFVVMSRPGNDKINYELENCELIEKKQSKDVYSIKNSESKAYFIRVTPIHISSTMLREKIKNRESIRYLLPDQVIDYIEKNKLYRSI